MSTISDLNVIVQQGSRARDMLQGGRQAHEAAQQASVQQEKTETLQRTTIQHSGEPEMLRPDKDGSEARKRSEKKTGKKNKKPSEKQGNGEQIGTIINTKA